MLVDLGIASDYHGFLVGNSNAVRPPARPFAGPGFNTMNEKTNINWPVLLICLVISIICAMGIK